MEPAEVEKSLVHFESRCRERGLPLTIQRRDIFKAILLHNDHPTADMIYEAVKDHIPGLSRTTVYRVLEALVDLGVVKRVHHPGTSARFDANPTRHHHLVCRICNKVFDLENHALDDLKLPSTQDGFQIEDYSVHIMGVCAECKRRGQARQLKH